MLSKADYRAKRREYEITTSVNQMFTTKLMVNKKPSLTSKERANIRASVHQLGQKISMGLIEPSIAKLLNSVSGLVGKLSRFHPTEGNKLKLRIKQIRQKLEP